MKKFFIILSCVIFFMLGACATTEVSAEQTNPIKIWFQNENGKYSTLNVIDEETGVHYIVVSAESIYGDYNKSIAITPRYNADGSLYVD